MSAKIIAVLVGLGVALLGAAGVAAWRYKSAAEPSPVTVATVPPTQGNAVPSLGLSSVPSSAPSTTPAGTMPKAASPTVPSANSLPQFDIVRVEPSGEAVIAGRAAPDSKVALIGGGKILGEVAADANGQFALVPDKLAPGDYVLSLRLSPKAGAPVYSQQSVVVSVPQKGKGDVVVALMEPGKTTTLLSEAPAAVAPAGKVAAVTPAKPLASPAAAASKASVSSGPIVAFKTAEAQSGGGFLTSGTAPPGARLRLYLNGSALADVTVAPDGRWSAKVGAGMAAGHYAVRADALDGAGKVVSRAEVPFDVPVQMAAATPASRSDAVMTSRPVSSASPTPGADAFVDQIETATVIRGDNLWNISRKMLGEGTRYTRIYTANSTQIRNPDLIYPGQIFVIPAKER